MKEKALTTLNEADSLSDVLLFEGLLLSKYAVAMTKCGGTCKAMSKAAEGARSSYISVLNLLKERGYLSAAEADDEEIKEKLSLFKNFLK